MYALFMAHLARVTGCAVFTADYRLAPEFPFPAAVDDIMCVTSDLLHDGLAPERLFIAGDSGGGGLVGTGSQPHQWEKPVPAGRRSPLLT